MSNPSWGQSAESQQGQPVAPINFYDPTKFQNNVQPGQEPGYVKQDQSYSDQQYQAGTWNWNSNPERQYNGTQSNGDPDTVPLESSNQASPNQWGNNQNTQWNSQHQNTQWDSQHQQQASQGDAQYWHSPPAQWTEGQETYNSSRNEFWLGAGNFESHQQGVDQQGQYVTGQEEGVAVPSTEHQAYPEHQSGSQHAGDGFNSHEHSDFNNVEQAKYQQESGGFTGFFSVQPVESENRTETGGVLYSEAQGQIDDSPGMLVSPIQTSESVLSPDNLGNHEVLSPDNLGNHEVSSPDNLGNHEVLSPDNLGNHDQMPQHWNDDTVQGNTADFPYQSLPVQSAQNLSTNQNAQSAGNVESKPSVRVPDPVPAPQPQTEHESEGDWELVHPHQGASGRSSQHSRDASLDSNVQFFIGSGSSSTRVSPFNTGSVTEPDHVTASDKVAQSSPAQAVVGQSEAKTVLSPLLVPPPTSSSTSGQAPPPHMSKNSQNPFRRTPLKSKIADPMLSSTHLDIAKPDLENSPVVLNKSISPILKDIEDEDGHTPSVHDSRDEGGNRIPQSPILPRKESPFQPPEGARRDGDSRSRPLKGDHDIPGVNADKGERQPAYLKDHTKRNTMERENMPRGKDMDNSQREMDNMQGRRTPDWDGPRSRGRKTPDLEVVGNRGRKTPDRESRNYKGRKTPDWDSPSDSRQSKTDRENGYGDNKRPGRESRYKYPDKETALSSRPPIKPSSGNTSSNSNRVQGGRQRQSAFHQIQANRSILNASPATTLWDTDLSVATSNIILVQPTSTQQSNTTTPAEVKTGSSIEDQGSSLLTPVASLITSMSEQIKTDGSSKVPDKQASISTSGDVGRNGVRALQETDLNRESRGTRVNNRDSRDTRYERGNHDVSRISSRDHVGGSRDSSRDRHRGGSVERERDRYDRDDYKERGDYGDKSYRDRDKDRSRYRDNRPPSRTGSIDSSYSRREYPYKDRSEGYNYRDEKYERPRSRHDENRPVSRQGDVDRPRSRTDFEREQYYKDKHRGYNYEDYYGRGGQYYDQQYYDYYNNAYAQGYYDEMGYYHESQYGNRYPYPSQQQGDAERYPSGRQRSRVNTPGSLSDGGEEILAIEGKKGENKNGDSKGDQSAKTPSKNPRFNFPPNLHEQSGHGAYDEAYYNYYHNYGRYPDSQYGYEEKDTSSWVQQPEVEPQRQTPEKFVIPHMRASFGPNGLLVKVMANRPTDGQPATIELHEVSSLLEDMPGVEDMRDFPGPLVRGDTHKNDVLLYCQKKTKHCQDSMDMEDRESAELIWRLLELLIKQNGTVVGTDIADLLLENHEPTTLEYRKSGVKISSSVDNLDTETDDLDSTETLPQDRSKVNRAPPVEDVTDRFRHLLLYGRKKDALEWAMKHGLWGHALFLASKMDNRAHANVMTRFANVAMRMNDPLQTLYQLMSGRQPAAVTSVTEERWGDWRPHLAMILSNHSSRPDLDRKSITTLGDTLAGRGFLHASHFCYLMSQTSFGSFNKKSSKLVLIGSSHSLPLETFANNTSIQCTEIYEYALALGNTAVSMVNFQYFKYLYATRLAEAGFSQEALSYCEVISRAIHMNPTAYQPTLVQLLFNLASQLQFSDPQRHEGGDDTQDPEWLVALQRICQGFQDGSIQPASGTVTPLYMAGTTASSESGEVATYMQEHAGMPAAGTYGYGSQEQQQQQYGVVEQDYNGQVTTGYDHSTGQANTAAQEQLPQQDSWVFNYTTNQWEATSGSQVTEGSDPSNQTTAAMSEGHNSVQQQQPAVYEGVKHGYTGHQHQGISTSDNHQGLVQHTEHSQMSAPTWSAGQSQMTSGHNDTSVQRNSIASTVSEDISEGFDEDETDGMGESVGSGQNQNIFDICQANRQPKIIPPRLRKRTMSGSSAGSTGSSATAIHKPSSTSRTKQNQSLGQTGSKEKAGSGLFGGFLNIFKSKGKNEMILPDDKKPSIVWDDKTNRWVNLDGGQEEESPAGPPPKDADLGGGPPMPHPMSAAGTPNPLTGTAPRTGIATGTGTAQGIDYPDAGGQGLGGNRFARAKGRGARSQYVDVLNPKPSGGSQVPPSLFHTLPSSASAPAIFVPGGQAASDDAGFTKSGKDQTADAIPEERHNPASNIRSQTPGGLHPPYVGEESSLSRASSTSSLSQEVQNFMAKNKDVPAQNDGGPAPNMSGPAPNIGGPMMFDPAQFQSSTSFKQPQQGHRMLGNRRVYPK